MEGRAHGGVDPAPPEDPSATDSSESRDETAIKTLFRKRTPLRPHCVTPTTIFAGDVAYNGMHAYLADGRWREWLAALDRLDADLPDDVTLYVGHGPPGDKGLLAGQRRYIETFVDAVESHADAIDHGDHSGVIDAMRRLLPTDSLLFLMDLSIEPTLASLRQAG